MMVTKGMNEKMIFEHNLGADSWWRSSLPQRTVAKVLRHECMWSVEGQTSQCGQSWVSNRIWRDEGQGPLGYCKDSSFCSQRNGNHCRICSRKITWCDLHSENITLAALLRTNLVWRQQDWKQGDLLGNCCPHPHVRGEWLRPRW